MPNQKPLTKSDLLLALKEQDKRTKSDLHIAIKQTKSDLLLALKEQDKRARINLITALKEQEERIIERVFNDRTEFYAKMVMPEFEKLRKEISWESLAN